MVHMRVRQPRCPHADIIHQPFSYDRGLSHDSSSGPLLPFVFRFETYLTINTSGKADQPRKGLAVLPLW